MTDTAGTRHHLGGRLGATLGDGYTVERELGGGGMSRVFVVRDARLGRQVVAKVLHPDLAAGLSAARFEREVTLAARLQHPHVVPVHAAGEVDGLPYYTMPYVQGESLRERLGRERALPVGDAVRLVRELADALAYAHGEGVVHRDLKPENVLLSGGHAVVADFGIAKALATATQGGAAPGAPAAVTGLGLAVGTPAYMAPEQAAADPATDHRADLYALGIIAYEALAGAHPFAGRAPQAMLAAHLTEAPAPLTARRPDAPPALAALVHRLLAKRPEDRPQSARDVVRALDDGAAPRPRRRVPARAALIAAAVVAAAGAAGVLVPRLRRAAPADGPVMLAVLPFDNEGPTELRYFADGLTDAIAGKLAGVSGVGVVDQRSAAQYRGTTKPARQVGEELGVDYLLEGVVRWAPDAGAGGRRAQIVPRLVRARDATRLPLGDPVVVTPADPFGAQTEVASQVVEGLGVALAEGEARRLTRRPTADAEAYDAFLRGRAFYEEYVRSSQPQNLSLAAEHLERAVALDSRFAAAWALLSDVRWTAVTGGPQGQGTAVVGRRGVADVGAAADSALRLDPTLPEAWTARARYLYLTGDQLGARAAAGRAARLAPLSAEAWTHVGAHQYILGHADSGRVSIARAVRLAPRVLEVLGAAALFATITGHTADAEAYADRMLTLDPRTETGFRFRVMTALYLRGDTLLAQRRLDEALRQVRAPSAFLLLLLPYARGAHLAHFARLSAGEVGGAARVDTVAYHDAKADAYTLLGRPGLARAHRDSIRRALAGGVEPGPFAFRWRLVLAAAEAGLGRRAEALRHVRAIEEEDAAIPTASRNAFESRERAYRVAQVHALLGDADAATAALRRALAPPSAYGAAFLPLDPKLAALRGDPRFERLVAGPRP